MLLIVHFAIRVNVAPMTGIPARKNVTYYHRAEKAKLELLDQPLLVLYKTILTMFSLRHIQFLTILDLKLTNYI